jgi:chaperonin cofactor prefoldin
MAVNRWKVLAITFIVLFIITLLIAIGNASYYGEYTALKSQYDNLLSRYESLESQYSALQSQYNALESQYSSLQSSYQSLQSQYSTLQSQYNTLYSEYQGLQSELRSVTNTTVIGALASSESYSANIYTVPGGYVLLPIIVPSGYTASVSIQVSSNDFLYVDVYKVSDYDSNEAVMSISPPPSLYEWSGAVITQTITLQPGKYFIEVQNSIMNSAGATVNIQVTTTLTPG